MFLLFSSHIFVQIVQKGITVSGNKYILSTNTNKEGEASLLKKDKKNITAMVILLLFVSVSYYWSNIFV